MRAIRRWARYRVSGYDWRTWEECGAVLDCSPAASAGPVSRCLARFPSLQPVIRWPGRADISKEESVSMSNKECLIAAALSVAAIFLSTAQADESAIQAHCQSKWSGDAMRAYCMEEQRQSAEAIAGYSGPVRSRCESEWGSDFHMVLFCIREQQRPPQTAAREQATGSTAN